MLVVIFLAPIVVVMWPAVLVLLAVGLIVEKGILMPVLGTLGTQDVFSLALWHPDTVTKPVYSAKVRFVGKGLS